MSLSRVVVGDNIGGSARDESRRQIGWGLVENGWAAYIERRIEPAYRAGARRFEIHNPWGKLRGEPMQADQAIDAAKLDKLYELVGEYVPTWRRWQREHDDAEVIAYLGGTWLDQSFESDIAAGRADRWLWRLWESYRAPLAAGQSIGLDAMAAIPDPVDHPGAAAVGDDDVAGAELLRVLAARYARYAYIETAPPLRHTWAHRFRCMVVERAHRNLHQAPQHPGIVARLPGWFQVRISEAGDRLPAADQGCTEYVRLVYGEPDQEAAAIAALKQDDSVMIRRKGDDLDTLRRVLDAAV